MRTFLTLYWPLCVSLMIMLALGWPGRMDFDSYHQYHSALVGQYADHHPFIMSFFWHYLDKVIKGPLLLFFYNMALLYGGLFFLIRSLPPVCRFWVPFLPFFPPVLVFSYGVLKDVTYAFSFFYVCSVLGYLAVEKKPLSWPLLFGLCAVLAYGTMVKFQAQYIAPLLLLWMALHLTEYHFGKALWRFVILCLCFYGAIMGVHTMAPPVAKNHSWQAVKIFDLAGMSVSLQKVLLPQAIMGDTSLAVLTKTFEPWAVDPLWKVINGPSNDADRDVLLHTWRRSVEQYPMAYVQHRAYAFAQMVLPEKKIQHIQKHVGQYLTNESLAYKICVAFFSLCTFFLYSGPLLCASLFFLALSLVTWRKTVYAIPLFFFNVTGLSMAAILLVLSMAAVTRYLYITTCLCVFSLPFAILCWKKRLA